MRAEATARLRLRVGAYEHKQPPAVFEHVAAALRGADERPRRFLVHATIIVTAVASTVGAMFFGV